MYYNSNIDLKKEQLKYPTKFDTFSEPFSPPQECERRSLLQFRLSTCPAAP
jgi:hypothetical protein